MIKRLIGLLFLVFSLIPCPTVVAEVTSRIVVLPFDIRSDKDLSYLKTQIPAIISGQLEKDGGVIVDTSSMALPETGGKGFDTPQARSIGSTSNADHVIWGSLTRTGKRISLDVKLLDIKKNDDLEYIHAEGDDIENLLSTVNNVAMSIGTHVFKFESIWEIVIKGNERIESDAILNVIKTKAGDRYQKAKLSEDLKRIFAMGYFEDIRIESDRNEQDGVAKTKIIFTVQEKPTVRYIKVKGNKAIETEDVMKEITITEGSILNSAKIRANINLIEALYEGKHYHNTKVTYKTYPKENNQAELEFNIEEGEKVSIKEITFVGNKAYTLKQLKKLMKTEAKGFFSWLTSSGQLNTADLNMDMAVIGSDYQKNGFIDVKIGEPEIKYEGKWIFITVKIEEGIQYKRGKIDIEGDLIETKEVLIGKLSMPKEVNLNKEVLQKDVIALTDVYSDKGYASVNIHPRINRNDETKTADVVFDVKKGNLVYFDRIIIGGNTVTRDKVIRRQIQVYEKELFSGSKLKRSIRNLYRMDYFEDVKVDTQKGAADDTMNLMIDLKEKPTGTFTFGLGYSSESKLFGTVAVAKRNLFGRDQTLNLQGEFGSESSKYSVSFTEPWLFDIPLSAQIELMNWERKYDYYDKHTVGGALKFGYPVFDYTRLYMGYSYEVNDLYDMDEAYLSESTIELKGKNVTQSITSTIHLDSRDRANNAQATEGSDCALSVEYAGGVLGGEIGFTKYKLTAGRYIPLPLNLIGFPLNFIGFLHAEGGFVRQNGNDILPDYETFYLGGMNSVRGFDYNDICLTETRTMQVNVLDANGNQVFKPDGVTPETETHYYDVDVGGEKYMQYNAELLLPLFKTEGFLGLVFFDMGNVYDENSFMDFGKLRKSWGYGVRWFSPIGPIRFERGHIINPEPGESRSGKWDFTMGGTF